MIKKIVMFSFLFFATISKSFSQPKNNGGITGWLTKIVAWIPGLDNGLTGIDNKENLYDLDRHLGYTSLYIDQIVTAKQLLAKEISDLKTDKDDNKHIASLNKRTQQIIQSINDLKFYLTQIKSLLSLTNQKGIDSVILQIENDFENRKLNLLSDIKEKIYLKNIPYDQIVKESEESRKIADNALKQIKATKEKIIAALTK